MRFFTTCVINHVYGRDKMIYSRQSRDSYNQLMTPLGILKAYKSPLNTAITAGFLKAPSSVIN